MSKEKIIGIDLGTTNSCISIIEGGIAKVIENSEGSRTTPSVVAYVASGEVLVGMSAKRQAITNPKNTISAAKRLIGRRFQDADIQNDVIKKSSFEVVEAQNGDAWVKIGDQILAPQQISAEILRKMKKTAEDYLGHKVEKAVITVPAYFNDSQRQATKDAGQIAGLKVERIINEPTAAALAYGINNKKENQVIAVYDLGGGTFDISIIEINNVEGENQIEVLSTNGNTFLGGEDFDSAIMDFILNSWSRENTIDLRKDILALQRIRESSEKAKIELSTTMQTRINLPFITMDANGPKHIDMEITRSKFESLVDHLIQATLTPCSKALEDAKLTISGITDVLLIGGQTRMPKVKEAVAKFFGRNPRQDTNPDEAVAMGAAIQGGVLAGDVKELLLLDVTPLSLGIETMGGICTVLIPRNTTIPMKKSDVFSTAENNQTEVQIHILQGESQIANKNKSLGRFTLQNIPAAPRGIPQIEVTFDIDANGILHVGAQDKKTGNQQSISITASGGLSEREIQDMMQTAKENEESDKKLVELIKTKNQADSLVHSVEKFIDDTKDLSDSDKTALQHETKNLQELIKKADVEQTELENGVKALEKIFYPIAQKSYESASKDKASDSSADPQKPVMEEAEIVENNK